MRHFFKLSFFITILLLLFHISNAQNTNRTVSVKTHSQTTEKRFGNPQSISEVTDILENNEAYNALKDLIENHHITIVYADNSFLGNANLKRGDFIVSYNSALDHTRDAINNAGLDTLLINTYDRNKAYITSVTQVKDIKPGNVYYNAVESLLEEWGINAPFTKAALLNAQSLFYQDELYDILRVTLGYDYGTFKPKKMAITRYHFAIIFDNALKQKLAQVQMLADEKKAKDNAEKARVDSIIKQIEQNRRDSIGKEIEMRKAEAEKKEAEARKKLEDNK
jgi:hypothetical protein